MEAIDGLFRAHGVEIEVKPLDVNVLRLALASNVPNHPTGDHFVRSLTDAPADYRVNYVDLDGKAPAMQQLAALADNPYRGKWFRTDCYLTHRFGEPTWPVNRRRRIAVFGRRLNKIIWPYAVKHLLTVHAADKGALHSKADQTML